MPSLRPLRLGIVPYLNVHPLLEGLAADYPESLWTRGTPRELAMMMENAEVDVATLPIYEALREGSYSLIPGCAIACDGPVRSVQLFCTKPFEQVYRVLLDSSSLTSIHLIQILAPELLGIRPYFEVSHEPIPRNFDLAASSFDAAVVIGDVALEWESRFLTRLDLGEGWKRLTGLPFVFAGWVVRNEVMISPQEATAFLRARQRGERAVSAIAAREAAGYRRPPEDIEDYLTNSLRFRLGERELESIEAFRQKLIRHELIAASTPPLDADTTGCRTSETW